MHFCLNLNFAAAFLLVTAGCAITSDPKPVGSVTTTELTVSEPTEQYDFDLPELMTSKPIWPAGLPSFGLTNDFVCGLSWVDASYEESGSKIAYILDLKGEDDGWNQTRADPWLQNLEESDLGAREWPHFNWIRD